MKIKSFKFSHHKTQFLLIGIFLIALLGIGMFFNIKNNAEAQVSSAPENEITGWMYSPNVGWISMNCLNEEDGVGCDTSNYQVRIDNQDGSLIGNAWSPNIGWIDFGLGLNGPNDIEGSNAKVVGDKIVGWAKAERAIHPSGETLGKWDGWLSFNCEDTSCANSNYNVKVENDTSGGKKLSGYAWGGDGVGWVEVDARYSSTQQPTKTPSVWLKVNSADSAELDLPTPVDDPANLTWGSRNVASCIGTWESETRGGAVSIPGGYAGVYVSAPKTYTINCLSVPDLEGKTSTVSDTVTITQVPATCTVDLTATPSFGIDPLAQNVVLTADPLFSRRDTGPVAPIAYAFSCNGGSRGVSTSSSTYTCPSSSYYGTPGNYTASVRVTKGTVVCSSTTNIKVCESDYVSDPEAATCCEFSGWPPQCATVVNDPNNPDSNWCTLYPHSPSCKKKPKWWEF